MRPCTAVIAATVLSFALAGCAGTPPPGEQASAGKRAACVHETGSMLCTTSDDGALSSSNSPVDSTPRASLSQGANGGSH